MKSIGEQREHDRAAFNEAYSSLNAAQKQAVDTIEGPVMVIAGPGTGKTQILALRIANILLKTDTAPESILALTFTESGAKAMRERLLTYIDSAAYRVAIFTFHGFAERLIAKYPDSYPKIIGGRAASDIDKVTIIETILNSGEVETLRPGGNPQYYVKPVRSTLSDLKREYITPDKLAELIGKQEKDLDGIEKIHEKGAHKGKVRGDYKDAEKSIEKNKALLFVYRQYEALLQEQNLYDFDDMILETVEALSSNEDMLRDLQEAYQYILADEHQDVNGSQNKILELLASYHDSPNIFVVGDEKQAIFRFQGASLENFLYFGDLFKGTTTISLTENYRSGQEILDAAQSLIAVGDGPLKDLRIPLNAAAVSKSEVELRDFSHQAIEDDWVVKTIGELITKKVPPSEIAVIVRSNQEVEYLSHLIRTAGHKVSASADSDILHHPITHTIEELMRAVTSTDQKALFTVLHGAYWGIPQIDLMRVLAAQSYERSLSEIVADEELLKEIGVSEIDKITNVSLVLNEARKRAVTDSPHTVLAYLIEASGLKDFVMTNDPLGAARVVRRLFDEIEEQVRREKTVNLTEVVSALNLRRQYGLPLNAPYIATDTEAVQVMTAHKSKGLEFEVVIAPHLTDNSWGGRTSRTNFKIKIPGQLKAEVHDAADDERRLLYVLMTRAKNKLFLSSSETNPEGKALSPSRLLADIEEGNLSVISTEEVEAAFVPLGTVKPEPKESILDTTFLTKVLTERGFSATSLNNYLRSPWDYFYRNVLRIPEIQPVHMQFGTAIHNVMERVTKEHTTSGEVASDSAVKGYLERELGKLPINTEDFTRLHKKGLEALLSYIPQVSGAWPKKTQAEMSLRVVMDTGLPELPQLPLTGKLDRLDFDDEGRVVKVVDYKTGKPKTRNVIEGNTQSSDGSYKRQLVFYALLLELYDDERYKCRNGVLSFVEPDSKGAIHEEEFTITDQEIVELKEEIIKATKEIISGEFIKTDCDSSVSEYCHLVSLLKDNE